MGVILNVLHAIGCAEIVARNSYVTTLKEKSVHYRMIQKGKANHACILLTIACLNVLTSCLTYYKAVKQHLIGKRKSVHYRMIQKGKANHACIQ